MEKLFIIIWIALNGGYYFYAKGQQKDSVLKDDILYILGLPIVKAIGQRRVIKLLSEKELYKLKKIYATKELEAGLSHFQTTRIGMVYGILFFGILFSLILGTEYVSSFPLDYRIERPEYGSSAITYDLRYEIENSEASEGFLPLHVEPKLPTKEEAILLMTQKVDDLKLIIFHGEAIHQISRDLDLPNKPFIEPITITYESLTPEFVTSQGKIRLSEMEVGKPYKCSIVATLSIVGLSLPYTYEFTVVPNPKSFKEITQNLEGYITSEPDHVVLPKAVENQTPIIHWSTAAKGTPFYKIIILTLLLSTLFYRLKQYELDQRIVKRKEEILYDFPIMVNKLTMLVNAGMTFNRAWHKIVKDYQDQNKGVRMLYEEMFVASQEMLNGVSEVAAIEAFARRSQCKEVIRLAAILTQNLKMGSQSMTDALKLLSLEVWELRVSTARKMGEKASTKLLLPMGISLITVLMIVIVPTFMTMKI